MEPTGQTPAPGELGLPENSALTPAGRIERAQLGGVRSPRHTAFAPGLLLILGVLAAVLVVAAVSYLV